MRAGNAEIRKVQSALDSVRIKAEICELLGPVRVGITQALDVDASREAPLDSCLDEFWSKKCERERQIDLVYRASLPFYQLPGAGLTPSKARSRVSPTNGRLRMQRRLAPVSIGLLLAGSLTIAKEAIFGLETTAIAVGVMLILLQTRINPALLVLGAAVVGMLSFA